MTSGLCRGSVRGGSALLLLMGLGLTPLNGVMGSNEPSEVHRQQTFTVSGSVIDDETRQPIAGVTVIVGGSPRFTTDNQGRFDIQVEARMEVAFQSVGYQR